ncbi:HD-GYP domain-containing protein [Sulfidibacter corallicola]|uniref:HD-GYP domain-containing protein n=1 Tax=Sulfidibacter corallicola TaxID=2818388 RepID=A0A8A4TKA9_SULCO|nr:HD-GYP domain-containing protein [Sulfidibacter corallicola]QTD50376.1 HD-GYP domain-containing protein [Sulfidibacter corallicola]
MKKKIAIDQLRPGMYVHSLNRSWIRLPFFSNPIRNVETVTKLRAYEVTEVVIDTSRGLDVPPETPMGMGETAEDVLQQVHESAKVHAEAGAETSALFRDVQDHLDFDDARTDRQVQNLTDQVFRDPHSMLCLSVLRNADTYTYEHSVNVCILALFLGRSLNLSQEELFLLGKGALLHDIGKCMIPQELLQKTGTLTDEETRIMQNHVELGVDYLRRAGSLPEPGLSFISHHHERLDGSGYPRGLKSDAISRFGKLAAVLDIYDAMLHRNHYKEPIDPHTVLLTMRAMVDTQLDPDAYRALCQCLGPYPPGTLLMLNSGEMAIAFEPNGDSPERPRSLLITTPDGTIRGQPIPCDLTQSGTDKHGYARSIVTAINNSDILFNPLDIIAKEYSMLPHGVPLTSQSPR